MSNATSRSDDVDVVVVREVGPRDGLQSVAAVPSTADKTTLVNRLARAGLRRIEAGAFVSPRAVPQMADSGAVFAGADRSPRVSLEALVLNGAGMDRAVRAGADAVVAVVAASETFSRKNVRMSTSEALRTARSLGRTAADAGVRCVADVATAFGCAYEGQVADSAVLAVVAGLADAGIREITLADTTGMAAPPDVHRLVGLVRREYGADVTVGLHFHNTRGLGLTNVYAGLDAGVRLFDSSVGGLGGCPFSPGATGNVCTEDLVHMLELLGIGTGVDLGALLEAARFTERALGFQLPGQLLRSGPGWQLSLTH